MYNKQGTLSVQKSIISRPKKIYKNTVKLFTKLMSSFSLWYKYLHWDFVHVQIKCNQTSLATSARNLDTDFVNTILTEKKKMISSLARLYNTWNLALTTFWYEIWTRHYSDMVTSFLELSSTPSVHLYTQCTVVHPVYIGTPLRIASSENYQHFVQFGLW